MAPSEPIGPYDPEYARYPVRIPLSGQAASGPSSPIAGAVLNISSGGLLMLLRTGVPLARGATVDLEIRAKSGPLSLRAQVVWTAPDPEGQGMLHGVQFSRRLGGDRARQIFQSESGVAG